MRIGVGLAAALAAGAAGGVGAQQPAADELDQRLKVIERRLEIEAEEAQARAREAAAVSAGERGFVIRKGDFELKLRGLVQADLRTYLGDDAPRTSDSVLLRRIRPTFEGSLGSLVGFRLTPEFAGSGSGDAASIVDAYVDLRFHPAATVRAGKVKGPVGLERLQSGGAIPFIERGLPTELVPNRDLGVQLQGEVAGGALQYVLGQFNGTADGRDATGADADNRRETGARLFLEPFRNSPGFLQGLGFGVGGTYGSKRQGSANAANANLFLPRYRTPGQNTFFAYRTTPVAATALVAGTTGVFADGDHVRVSPQLYFYRHSFGLLAEYVHSAQEVAIVNTAAGPGAVTAIQDELAHRAWQGLASVVLTGEEAAFRGVAKPARPFTPGGDGWGALELVVRHGRLEIDADAYPVFANPASAARSAESSGAGLNWLLTGNVKVAVNYVHTSFVWGGGGTAGAPLDREPEDTVFARLQLSF